MLGVEKLVSLGFPVSQAVATKYGIAAWLSWLAGHASRGRLMSGPGHVQSYEDHHIFLSRNVPSFIRRNDKVIQRFFFKWLRLAVRH